MPTHATRPRRYDARRGGNGRGSGHLDGCAGARDGTRDVVDIAHTRERAVLVAIEHGRGALLGAEESIAELARLSDTAGLDVAGKVVQAHQAPASRHADRRGQDRGGARRWRRTRGGDAGGLRRRALAGAAAQSREAARRAGDRSHPADPRHLRPARHLAGRQAAGRAGAARVSAAAPHPAVVALVAPRRRRGRRARPRRDPARGRPPARARAHRRAAPRLGEVSRTRALHRAEPRRGAVSDRRAGRLHQLGQVDADERAHARRRAGRDQLFATLDPTVRLLRLPDGGEALLVDTVGFIHKLPHGFVDAFKSTLEEVQKAQSAAARRRRQRRARAPSTSASSRTCSASSASTRRRASPSSTSRTCPAPNGSGRRSTGPTCAISARTGDGLPQLLRQISTLLAAQQERLHVSHPGRPRRPARRAPPSRPHRRADAAGRRLRSHRVCAAEGRRAASARRWRTQASS